MDEKEFNLLYEPWIIVMKADGELQEVSILELFRDAHNFNRLAGELPTQDIAVLRLMLAILHAVFARRGVDGNQSVISSPTMALKRWKSVWDEKVFPINILKEYLEQYSDLFWLIHPNRPFYQIPDIGKSTTYSAAKLNGELSESGNKIRLFSQRTGDKKNKLTYSEATRWLLYVNAYDDTSAKPTKGGMPSSGAGWLGKLGLITASGSNLFETLMLNLVLLKDGGNELWEEENPVWERNTVKRDERSEISIPNNPSELLTLQSRRLLLNREDGMITGYSLLGGDFFTKDNAFNEQMTVWRKDASENATLPKYTPKRHDSSRKLWRDFSVLVGQGEDKHRPGIVSWISLLKEKNLISRQHFLFQIVAIKYGDKDFFVDDVFSDSLSINANLLTKLGENWINRILREIEITEKLVKQVGYLAKNLMKAAGDKEGKFQEEAAKEQAYYRLDIPFRQWLEDIDPISDEEKMDNKCNAWQERARKIVRKLGKELVDNSGAKAFVGRIVKEKINGKEEERFYTSSEAYNLFLYRTSLRN